MTATTQQPGRPAFDEAYRADGAPREHYEGLLHALEGADLLGAARRRPGGRLRPVRSRGQRRAAAGMAWEHAQIARLTGAQLVTLDDLKLRDGWLLARRPDSGGTRRVDVVLRRSDEDSLRDEHGEPTAIASLVLEPWLAAAWGS